VVDIICPPNVGEGDRIEVAVNGQQYELLVPAGVEVGHTFSATLSEQSAADAGSGSTVTPSQSAADAGSGSTVTPSQLAGMQHMVRQMATGFLQAALQRVLQAIDRDSAIQEYIDANASAFVDYRRGGEHLLEWTAIHDDYCALVEAAIRIALDELNCNAATVLEYAQTFGNDPKVDGLLSRLLALSDYHRFCAMMRAASEQDPSAC